MNKVQPVKVDWKQTKKKAINYYKQAADLGYAESAYNLYNHYKEDKDEKDEKEASKWVQLAAENGYAPAQYAMGRQYYAKQEPQEAIKYLTLAANQEHGQAQHILGLLLYQKSSYQNLDSAETWLQKATRNGRTEAQALLQKVQEEKRLRYLAAFRDLNLKTTNSSSSSSTGST